MSRLLIFSIVVLGTVSAFGQTTKPGQDAIDKIVQQELPNLGWQVDLKQADAPPVIDGLLDDEAWKNAAVITDFTQVEPIEGTAPSEKTEVRILYDSNNLYLAIRCFDQEPEKIRTTQLLRDGDLGADDHVRFILDTYFDRRNAFVFEINAAGARGDGLLENSGDFNRDWDGIWYGRSNIDDQGWTAEFSLPTRTINFDPNGTKWGFNIRRFIRRKNETIRWATPRQDIDLFNVAESGILAAIEGLEQGVGLDVKPSLSLRYRRDPNGDHHVFNYEPSINIFYKITPDLTFAFTANTDFAETEVDERRVNLTRFPLFFPEKRDFFLQDAGIFRFGGVQRDPLPFFSRRIGISASGQPVDILAGIKLTGRVGDLNLGLVDVQVAAADGVDSKNLAVARVKYNVLQESSIGLIATAGDPTTNDYNFLGGIDFNYRNSKFLGDKVLTGAAFIQKSFTESELGDDLAFGARAAYPNDIIRWSIGFSEIQENYNPGLGFNGRRGIREYFGNVRFRHRPQTWIRTLEHQFRFFVVTDLDSELQSASLTINPIEIANQDGDAIEFALVVRQEDLSRDFEISDGVVIPVGTYSFVRYGVRIQTSSNRPVSLSIDTEFGDFYEGKRSDIDLDLEWRPSRHFFMSIGYEHNNIDLDFGSFQTHIARLRINVLFNADISWNTLVQYDNVSKQMGINSRFRWIIEPGREFFFVVNQGFLVNRDRFTSLGTEVTIKLGWTFRF